MTTNLEDLLSDAEDDESVSSAGLRELLAGLEQLSSTAQPAASPALARLLSTGRPLSAEGPLAELSPAIVAVPGLLANARASVPPEASTRVSPTPASGSTSGSTGVGGLVSDAIRTRRIFRIPRRFLDVGLPGFSPAGFGAKFAVAGAALAAAVAAGSVVSVPSTPISSTPRATPSVAVGPSVRPPAPTSTDSTGSGRGGGVPRIAPWLQLGSGPTGSAQASDAVPPSAGSPAPARHGHGKPATTKHRGDHRKGSDDAGRDGHGQHGNRGSNDTKRDDGDKGDSDGNSGHNSGRGSGGGSGNGSGGDSGHNSGRGSGGNSGHNSSGNSGSRH